MKLISYLAKLLPIDLGQGAYMHSTKGKQIAFSFLPDAQPDARALDVGCGDGYWSLRLQARGYAVVSLDQEREYPNADSQARYAYMVPADLNRAFPYPDASFNLIWCTEVIEHLTNYRGAIAEMRRVLKPGGRLIITTPNSYFWLHYCLKLLGLSHRDWQNEGHVVFFHLRDINALFPDAALYGYFPYVLFKTQIRKCVSFLSPTFVVIETKGKDGSQTPFAAASALPKDAAQA